MAIDDTSRRASLRASLAAAQSGWPAEGRSDQNGNVIGGSVLVRIDRVPAFDSLTMDQQRPVIILCFHRHVTSVASASHDCAGLRQC